MKKKKNSEIGTDGVQRKASQVKVSSKIGLPPGSMHYVGEESVGNSRIRVVDYSESNFLEKEDITVLDCLPFKNSENISWINIDGLNNLDLIDEVGKYYGIHSLLLEDIVNTEQRPKLEELDGLLYFTMKKISYNSSTKVLSTEQLSFVLGNQFLISFSEKPSDIFDPIYDRIRHSKNSIRKKGADYLLYALLDIIVDNYFSIIENIGEVMEDLEEDLLSQPDKMLLQLIHNNKKDLLTLRKTIYPLRELMYKLHNEDNLLITSYTAKYFGDIYDHTLRIVETLENYRDLNFGLKDIYLSSISLRMNQIMKVLTIISTIFIPLTFIVGVYGMNFIIPEIKWTYGYAYVWIVMVLISIILILIFKKKKWF